MLGRPKGSKSRRDLPTVLVYEPACPRCGSTARERLRKRLKGEPRKSMPHGPTQPHDQHMVYVTICRGCGQPREEIRFTRS